jgi:hypothetical protein
MRQHLAACGAVVEDTDSMPLEEAPEMFLDATDDCD